MHRSAATHTADLQKDLQPRLDVDPRGHEDVRDVGVV